MYVIPSEEYYVGKRGKLNRVRECGRQESKMILLMALHLYNPLSWSVERTCEYDDIIPIMQKEFLQGNKVPIS